MRVILFLTVLTLFSLHSNCEERSQPTSPFDGVPLTQSHVETENGSKIFRLRKEKSKRASLRNVNPIDMEDEIFFYGSMVDQVYEFFMGKSEETLFWEKAYKDVKEGVDKKRASLLGNAGDPYEIENTDGLNYEYLLQLYCGSQGTELSVTFDTGSDWTILQSAVSCPTCEGDMWDETASTSYDDQGQTFGLAYGSAEVIGDWAKDDFYLDEGQTFGVTAFDIMLITEQEGIGPSGGIMGFSRNEEFFGDPAGPLYYYYLLDAGEISSLIFASYLADYPTDSFFQVGDYDQVGTYYTGDIVWLDLTTNFFWEVQSTGYIVGGTEYELSSPINVHLDTGTSLMYFDKSNGKKMWNKVKGFLRGFKFFGNYYLKCDKSKYESMFLEMGGYFFEIPPSSILRDFSAYGYKWCDLGFRYESADEWLVGDTLFRSYYNVWDEENALIGFALRTGSDATVAPYLKT